MTTATAIATKLIENANKIELVEQYTDDHIECGIIELDGTRINLGYCGSDGIAAAKYANESQQAKTDMVSVLVESIVNVCELSLDDAQDEEDMALIELIDLDVDLAKKILNEECNGGY